MSKFKLGTTFNNEKYYFDDSKRQNTLVLGASGSGKTTGATNFLFNPKISSKSTYIVYNGKNEPMFKNQLIKHNKKFINIQIKPDNEYKLNPFSRMQTIEQVSILKEYLVGMLDFSSSAFYKDISVSLINFILEACFHIKYKLYYDTFINLFTASNIRTLASKCKDLPIMPPDLDNKEILGTITSLSSRYYSMFSLAGGYIYISSQEKTAKELDIIKTLNDGVSVIMNFNSLSYPELSVSLGLNFLQLTNQFVDFKALNQPVEIIMDEVTAYINTERQLQLLDNLISRGRSYNVKTSILSQSLHGFTQLVDPTNSFLENLTSNLTTLICFETGSTPDLEFVANFIGSEEVPFYTRQVEYNGSKPQFTKMGTWKMENKYKVMPEDIKFLASKYAPHYCVILNKRQSSRPAIINITK